MTKILKSKFTDSTEAILYSEHIKRPVKITNYDVSRHQTSIPV